MTHVPDASEGIVLYTDGSARPNPGFTGWGVHGYRYRNETTTKGLGLPKVEATAVGYRSGVTANDKNIPPVVVIEYYDMLGSDDKTSTNNGAEIDALIYAIQHLDLSNIQALTVYTDSDYLRRGLVDWVPIWARQQWRRQDGTTINNVEKWKTVSSLVETIKAQGIIFSIYWVKGHNGDLGNGIADKLATIGVMYSSMGIQKNLCQISPSGGYWKNTATKDPMIGFKRLYFNSTSDYNRPGHYYLVEPGGEEKHIGARLPEAAYCVLRLNTPDPVIEAIRDYQYKASNDINSVMIMRLDKVYSREAYKYIVEHGQFALVQNIKGSIGLNFVDNQPITIERNPAGLSLRAIEIYGFLDEILDLYVSDKLHERPGMDFRLHDITDVFYETKPVKSMLPKWFPRKIISGGQTGVDRAGLDWAIETKISHGGWCPKGRHSEDGVIDKQYKLKETPSKDYIARTEKNILDSDATLIINRGQLTSGTLMTFNFCKKQNKPVLLINVDKTDIAETTLAIIQWLETGQFKTLNIAGPRESKCPGIYNETLHILNALLGNQNQLDKLLKNEYMVGFTDLKVPVPIKKSNDPTDDGLIPVMLMLGLDLPSRNHLKRLEEHNPKIELLTWKESDRCLRYCTIMRTSNGVGIWSNFFADKIFTR